MKRLPLHLAASHGDHEAIAALAAATQGRCEDDVRSLARYYAYDVLALASHHVCFSPTDGPHAIGRAGAGRIVGNSRAAAGAVCKSGIRERGVRRAVQRSEPPLCRLTFCCRFVVGRTRRDSGGATEAGAPGDASASAGPGAEAGAVVESKGEVDGSSGGGADATPDHDAEAGDRPGDMEHKGEHKGEDNGVEAEDSGSGSLAGSDRLLVNMDVSSRQQGVTTPTRPPGGSQQTTGDLIRNNSASRRLVPAQ